MEDLRSIYNEIHACARREGVAIAVGVIALLTGCESAPARATVKPAPTLTPSSDVRRVDAWQDAERVAAQGAERTSVVGRGESMAPIFGDNTMLVLTKLPYEELAPGMIVAYSNARGRQVVHRLLERNRQGEWRVQGLNNPEQDPEPVTRWNYVGVVYASLVHEERSPPTANPAEQNRPPAPEP